MRHKHVSKSGFTVTCIIFAITSIVLLVYLSILGLVYREKYVSSSNLVVGDPTNTLSKNVASDLVLGRVDSEFNSLAQSLADVAKFKDEEMIEKFESESTTFQYRSDGCVTDTPTVDNGPHIVSPPVGDVTLVCCTTTKGIMSIAVHHSWAPIGAKNFLTMVTSNFFASEVPLFRSLKGFLVQFGLAGDPAVQGSFERRMGGGAGFLVDDPHWLPLGPPGRVINGTLRFQKGYIAYAGGGKNSRGTQLIIAFEPNQGLGGGSPWEVPFGQVVGENSLTTLGSIYTGYNEKPSQGKIRNRGKAYTKTEFPLMDYMTNCSVIREHVPWIYVKLSLLFRR